jgi:predicted nucleic acid-binding protein
MNVERVVVDANLAFKTLCTQRGDLRERLGTPIHLKFYSPRFLFVELFKYKERLSRATRLNETELLDALHTLTNSLEFINESDIPVGTWMEAYRLCGDVDEADTPYIALTLHLGARLWTDDEALKTGLRAKGFDSFFTP